jgi:hypothetical protein
MRSSGRWDAQNLGRCGHMRFSRFLGVSSLYTETKEQIVKAVLLGPTLEETTHQETVQ